MFEQWLPLHVFLFFAMTIFYFGEMREDRNKLQEEEKLKLQIRRMSAEEF
jgi:preprotein translocase subunit YajC